MSIVEKFESMAYGPAPEDPREVMVWLDRHGRRFGHFVGGGWLAPSAEQYFETSDPSTGDVLASVAQGSAEDVNLAVKAARGALDRWQALTPHARARYLYAIARQVQKHSRRLAVLETLDNGKTIRESRDIDIPLVARHFYHHAGWAQLLEQEFPGYAACGVVGQIIPWNFPLLMLAWKIAPALAAGNTVVLKPAEYTPLTALAFSLELGGKSPFIIFEDADLDSAVEGLVDGIWFNQGQVCCAGSRLLMQESIAEKLTAKVRDRMGTLRVGAPLDKAVDIGAIVARVQLERIQKLVEQGVAEGAMCWQPKMDLPEKGWFYPPTLLSNVHPASVVAQQEIFGPVLAAMTFRTPSEAVELGNNTAYGLAASVWSESVNVALHVAAQLKAGVVWVNSTNLFDASCGFGGYRESGYGREGGREGLLEYLEPLWFRNAPLLPQGSTGDSQTASEEQEPEIAAPMIDRTVKLYIGGKQARPDSGYSIKVRGADGALLGEAPLGNRKDIRNAVEAARKAEGWAKGTAHNRAQVLYYIAENLSQRAQEIGERLARVVGVEQAAVEVQRGIERIFSYAAWADKFDGAVHNPPFRNVALAMNEAIGTVGIVCPREMPLLGFVSLVMPAIAMGNTVVAVPSEAYPLILGDLYQVFETSDLPGGVVNIVTGRTAELTKVLAEHDGVDAIWSFGDEASAATVKALSIGNLKQVFTNEGRAIDWLDVKQGEGRWFLRHATQVKNIWVPYGE
jgi:aldehyde dehydrogenase (NAD+)